MGWLADCSESERAAVLAKLAGRAYLSEQELKDAQNQIKMGPIFFICLQNQFYINLKYWYFNYGTLIH